MNGDVLSYKVAWNLVFSLPSSACPPFFFFFFFTTHARQYSVQAYDQFSLCNCNMSPSPEIMISELFFLSRYSLLTNGYSYAFTPIIKHIMTRNVWWEGLYSLLSMDVAGIVRYRVNTGPGSCLGGWKSWDTHELTHCARVRSIVAVMYKKNRNSSKVLLCNHRLIDFPVWSKFLGILQKWNDSDPHICLSTDNWYTAK